MSEVAQLLHHLIALPSVNPAFLPAGHPHAGESRVANFLAQQAKRVGLDVAFQKVSPGRSNVLLRCSPSAAIKQRILLAPHLDTVNAEPAQFTPRAAGGRIYGRGACDTKGSIAAMMTALTRLCRSGRRPQNTEIIFAGLVDEEAAQTGASVMAASRIKVDLAIVGEPTRLQVVTAHKGSLWLRLETRGKAAHGACPHLGKNAVHEMARIVDLIETDYAQSLQRRRHPLLGRPTVNIGYIRGGTQPNIVPASCIAGLDRRTIPGETEAFVRAELSALLRQNGCRATFVNEKSANCLPLETDPALPLVRQFMSVARQRKPAGVDFFCDASILSQGGIPSIVFGPGDIAQAHTAEEWISQKSLESATDLLLQFLRVLP
jgi:acetylornithine deacetylase/succinyl-diaminopimelate desuccinylase-like protein